LWVEIEPHRSPVPAANFFSPPVVVAIVFALAWTSCLYRSLPRRKPIKSRDEFDALRLAMPDLDRLARYERRAWSRQKRAFREFIEIKSRRES
jgi:hypothetical protein